MNDDKVPSVLRIDCTTSSTLVRGWGNAHAHLFMHTHPAECVAGPSCGRLAPDGAGGILAGVDSQLLAQMRTGHWPLIRTRIADSRNRTVTAATGKTVWHLVGASATNPGTSQELEARGPTTDTVSAETTQTYQEQAAHAQATAAGESGDPTSGWFLQILQSSTEWTTADGPETTVEQLCPCQTRGLSCLKSPPCPKKLRIVLLGRLEATK